MAQTQGKPNFDESAEFHIFDDKRTVFSLSQAAASDENPFGAKARELSWLEAPARGKAVSALAHSLPLFTGSSRVNHLLVPGLTVVTGSTAVGKSDFIRRLGASTNILRLSAVEPFDEPDHVVEGSFDTADQALVAAIMLQRTDPTCLPAIDSLRATLFETKGTASSKGIINSFFTQVTRVSNSLASAGHTVMVTVNPMNSEPDFVEEFINKLTASCASAIVLESRSQGDDPTFKGYILQRPLRRKIPFTCTPGAVKPKDVDAPVPFHYTLKDGNFHAPALSSINALANSAI